LTSRDSEMPLCDSIVTDQNHKFVGEDVVSNIPSQILDPLISISTTPTLIIPMELRERFLDEGSTSR
jgi:hypothetical protein